MSISNEENFKSKNYNLEKMKKLIIRNKQLEEVDIDYKLNNTNEHECEKVKHLSSDDYIILENNNTSIKVLNINNSSHEEEIKLYKKYYPEKFI